MAKAKLIKELLAKTENKVGMMAEITDAIAKSGANIIAINAFGIDSNAIFRIVTTDNAKAIAAIKAKNIAVSEREAVSVALENRVGAASNMSAALKGANIDIGYIYGSTCDCGAASTIIFNCSDNRKAVEVLS